MATRSEFRQKLEELINSASMENNSDTPDFILATFLSDSLRSFDEAVAARDRFFRIQLHTGQDHGHRDLCQSTCNESHQYDVTCGLYNPSGSQQ